jgi:cell division protein FtsW
MKTRASAPLKRYGTLSRAAVYSALPSAPPAKPALTRNPSLFPHRTLFWLTVFLCVMSLVFLFSVNIGEVLKPNATQTSLFHLFRLAIMQALWVAVGFVAMALMAAIPPRFWQQSAWVWMALCVGVLALIQFTPLGHAFNGAERWIRVPVPVLGAITIQPSEAFKLASLFWFCALYALPERRRWTRGAYLLLAVWLFGVILVERQPDLGTAMLIFALGVGVAFLGGASLAKLGLLLATSVLGIAALIITPLIKSHLSGEPLDAHKTSYRVQRIMAMLDPWSDEQGFGYQMVHAQLAVGSGGLTGVGLGMGREKRYLPAAESDYIFATIAEEAGFLGGIIAISLLGGVVYACFHLALRARTRFGRLFAGGLALWIALSAGINLGMALGLLPTVGIPLPFLSAGGSALVSLMAALGVAQSIAREA